MKMLGRVLTVDRRDFFIKLWSPTDSGDYELLGTWDCAVGSMDFKTRPGVYEITARSRKPDWRVPDSQWAIDLGLTPGDIYDYENPSNPIKARWLSIGSSGRGVGIHGTSDEGSIGTRASHGCVRMRPDDVVELFEQVPVGTTVVIH